MLVQHIAKRSPRLQSSQQFKRNWIARKGLSERSASDGQMVFDAAFVSTEIKRKYKIKE
jgi:hypothetical protein